MFDLDRFRAECGAAGGEAAVRDLMARAVEDAESLRKVVGEPRRAEVQVLHRSPTLTILNVVWGPRMTVMPHNHEMWAVIGIYGGREDNIFWRRLPGDERQRVEAAGARSLGTGQTVLLGRDIIHSVTNPLGRLTGALHVYGGDFFGVPRTEWDAECLTAQPYDAARALALFEESNRLHGAPS